MLRSALNFSSSWQLACAAAHEALPTHSQPWLASLIRSGCTAASWSQPQDPGHHRWLSTSLTARAADPEQQQQDSLSSSSSASEAASSFIVNPAGVAAAPQPAQHAPTAGGVLAGPGAAAMKEYSMRQVSKHADDESCWIVVNGKVYDVTSYLDDHPGGSDSILQNSGVDCTDEFMAVHSQEARELLEKFVIGTVKAGTAKAKQAPVSVTDLAAAAAADPSKPKVLLQDPKERYALPLAYTNQLNHDTFFMRFALPAPDFRMGLPCGKHVFLCADINGEGVVRAYTPVSGDRDLGVLDFLIKVYWAGEHPQFPEGGKMTQHLAAMKEGDTIDVKGPFGKFSYEGSGNYTLNRVQGKAKYLSMVAGGSGVTPCFDVAREVLQDPNDNTRMSLVYANKHEEDIWLRKELDAMAADNPDRFHVWYVVEEPTSSSSSSSSTSSAQPAAAAMGSALYAAAAAAGAASPGASGEATAAAAAAGAQSGAAAAAAAAANPARWRFSKGWVTPDMLAQHLLPPRPLILPNMVQQQGSGPEVQSLALMCGPPGMLENVVVPSLTALGFKSEQMVVF